MNSVLITSDTILNYVQQLYSCNDPIMCLWCTKDPPEENTNAKQEKNKLENSILFVKEDVESMFFPKGIQNKDWNFVLICLKERNKPILGWVMSTFEYSFLSQKTIEDIKVDL